MIIGAGLAGVIMGAELRKAGDRRLRFIDKAGGFGGTWYWNRYPGLMCDVESYIYMPMLEEMGYVPTTRYAFGEEIRLHLDSIGESTAWGRRAVPHRGRKDEWDEGEGRWVLHTDRGDEIPRSLARDRTGILNLVKIPVIPGMEDFEGTAFHSGRWDWAYTGGSPTDTGNMTNLADKASRWSAPARAPADPAAARGIGEARVRLPTDTVGHRRAGEPSRPPTSSRAT